jgi:hypothetical protein
MAIRRAYSADRLGEALKKCLNLIPVLTHFGPLWQDALCPSSSDQISLYSNSSKVDMRIRLRNPSEDRRLAMGKRWDCKKMDELSHFQRDSPRKSQRVLYFVIDV